VKTLERPSSLSDELIEFYTTHHTDISYYDEAIKHGEEGNMSKANLDEWKYLKWKVQQKKKFVFR
jgi:hypothetical protein